VIRTDHRVGQAAEQPVHHRGLQAGDVNDVVGVSCLAEGRKAQKTTRHGQGESPAASNCLKHEMRSAPKVS